MARGGALRLRLSPNQIEKLWCTRLRRHGLTTFLAAKVQLYWVSQFLEGRARVSEFDFWRQYVRHQITQKELKREPRQENSEQKTPALEPKYKEGRRGK